MRGAFAANRTNCVSPAACGLRACVAGVHLRYTDLQYESAQKTLPRATDVTDELYGVLRPLALALHRGRAVRQIGVSFGRLTGEAEQLSLFDAARHVRMRALDEATDTLRDKFGFDIVRRHEHAWLCSYGKGRFYAVCCGISVRMLPYF